MTFQQRAELIWKNLERDLDDRGCFHGIDNDTMDELRQSQIERIISLLGNQ